MNKAVKKLRKYFQEADLDKLRSKRRSGFRKN